MDLAVRRLLRFITGVGIIYFISHEFYITWEMIINCDFNDLSNTVWINAIVLLIAVVIAIHYLLKALDE